MLTNQDVEIVEAPIRELEDGEILIKMVWLQMDAAVRSWLDEGEGYLPAVKIGEPVRGGGMGRVIASKHPDITVGMWCGGGLPGWQEYAIANGDSPLVNPYPPDWDVLFQLAVISSPAATAYFGLKELGELKPGDSVLVSAAAGSTGSVAVQTALNLGASVVGIAGSDEKCRWVEELGAEACLNRRSDDMAARLKELRPKGFDIYFDNVGGPILDLALRRLGHRRSSGDNRRHLHVQPGRAATGTVELSEPHQPASQNGRLPRDGLRQSLRRGLEPDVGMEGAKQDALPHRDGTRS